ncbi:anaerobic ribonucleoside-triphosphate reductase activating protein [Clostridium botulinum]|uniref:anaerobic ribonucleoside-triphosphate reductase activating protein n=1 Tax=Clostridium botulinum TaxID=1491 RepID=UPI0004D7BC7D|nr:anaerobic ribonucleoside-triphosphate reductase activating protein [Clostridium botulinum]KEH96491.1 anaerobic ribonucleoside-triphosphate reductase activating protein [Clostridium botulinum D str. 16868]
MHYTKIIECDTNNGDGFRVSLFVSGCNKIPKCKNCHNKSLWDFDYGQQYTQQTEDMIIKLLSKEYISGLSIIGGEPTDNLKENWLYQLVKRVRKELLNKTIYCWTGYKFEDLILDKIKLKFIEQLDMLRDGEYIEELKNLSQYLGGSSNQRIIDVQKSLQQHKVVLYNC